ncbi:hypothetical protein RSOLAG1IB_00634 [Rhizoctonia solani AG-1 IB]|uniref:Uncharacterized protein n=1 Tax=Thanatephorus cucumeris (strain AG1-IB / isolate 7/3/14) TaxID=1108050 RepID=A0A0B7F7B4_THACB|nr:hypothetical protein RSOLAG1IB_00634 [Rhizoctonia solani AG-1 IB]
MAAVARARSAKSMNRYGEFIDSGPSIDAPNSYPANYAHAGWESKRDNTRPGERGCDGYWLARAPTGLVEGSEKATVKVQGGGNPHCRQGGGAGGAVSSWDVKARSISTIGAMFVPQTAA